jgi:hypothetical protein
MRTRPDGALAQAGCVCRSHRRAAAFVDPFTNESLRPRRVWLRRGRRGLQPRHERTTLASDRRRRIGEQAVVVSRFWGLRSRLAIMGHGVFDCPVCARQQPFELRQLARWFMLCSVPIARTRPLSEYVYCLGCRNPLKRDVLDAGSSSSAGLVPALQGPAYDVPESRLTIARPAATATTSAPSLSHTPVAVPATSPAHTASRVAAAAAATASAAMRSATARQSAPQHRDTVHRLPQTADVVARSSALSSGATPQESAERERPAFGQSAFARATFARQRRPAPSYGPAAVSEPAFFTPRR